MKFRLLCSVVALKGVACLAQHYEMTSEAFGNKPEKVTDSKMISGLANWNAAGRVISTYARADQHEWDPPGTESFAEAELNQADPANGFLRFQAAARVIYRPLNTFVVSGENRMAFVYDLEVQNTSSDPLNIVLGNQVHGLIGCAYDGKVTVSEQVVVGTSVVAAGSMIVDKDGFTGTGVWEHAGSTATVSDTVFLSSEIKGVQLNSYEFYGTYGFAPGESRTFKIWLNYSVRAEIPGDSMIFRGLAKADFMQTVNPTVKAYDTVTGADRSSEIAVGLVPEPSTWLATGLGLAAVAMRRRRK